MGPVICDRVLDASTHLNDRTQSSALDHLRSELEVGMEAILMTDAQLDTGCVADTKHLLNFSHLQRNRFLAEDALEDRILQNGPDDLQVMLRPCTDADNLGSHLLQHLPVITKRSYAVVPGQMRRHRSGAHIAYRDGSCSGALLVSCNVLGSDLPAADDGRPRHSPTSGGSSEHFSPGSPLQSRFEAHDGQISESCSDELAN